MIEGTECGLLLCLRRPIQSYIGLAGGVDKGNKITNLLQIYSGNQSVDLLGRLCEVEGAFATSIQIRNSR